MTLAVLSLLRERPRHPYEMQTLLRDRHVGEVVKLRGGSLYDAIRRLERAGMIEAVGSEQDGARPERTVYEITKAGVVLAEELVRAYLRTPAAEYPVFVAALAHILNVRAAEAADLLRERRQHIQRTYDEIASQLADRPTEILRVVVLEAEYAQTLRAAELAWLSGVIRDLENERLPWLELPKPAPARRRTRRSP